jgi:hypothetical protein
VDDRRVPWVALNAAVCEYPRAARIVLKAFPEVGDVFAAGEGVLVALGVRADVARKLAAPGALDAARG